MVKSLTDRQRELVELNHNLIYKFAYNNNLLIDDYYDILAIGLCKASMDFNENKGNFSTFAYICMLNELRLYWKNSQRKSVIPDALIMSYDVSGNDVLPNSEWKNNISNSLLDNFADKYTTHDIAVGNIISNMFIDTLTEKEKNIVKLIVNGYNQTETAEILNCTRQDINNRVKIIRKKLVHYLNNY